MMRKENLIALGLVCGTTAILGMIAIPELADRAKKRDKLETEKAMPDSYWEAKKAEAEASVEITKANNAKEIELKKLENEKQIKLNADRLEAEKGMPDEYFKSQQMKLAKEQAENIAKIQADSNEKIAKANNEAELKREKERNSSNEAIAREARWALNAIKALN